MKKLLLLLVFIAACGASVKDQPLTGENWEALKDSRELTAGELGHLNAYVMSQGMRSAITDTVPGPFDSGLTIGEAIEEGRARVEGMQGAIDDATK